MASFKSVEHVRTGERALNEGDLYIEKKMVFGVKKHLDDSSFMLHHYLDLRSTGLDYWSLPPRLSSSQSRDRRGGIDLVGYSKY